MLHLRMTYLWFVTKKGFVNLHNCPRTPKNDLVLEELCCAYFSEPLEYINCSFFSDLHFLSSISYWVLSCPKIDDQQPLLKGHPRLGKKTSFPNAVSSFALRTFPALPISHIISRPFYHQYPASSIIHIQVISIHVSYAFFFFHSFYLLTVHSFCFVQAIHDSS